jgi:flagellar biosynthesis protein FlhF
MELKRILARDSRTASEEALAQFGPDVLIVSSNRVNGQTELIVAIDVPQVDIAASSAAAAPQPVSKGSDFASTLQRSQQTASKGQDPSPRATTASQVLHGAQLQDQHLSEARDTLRAQEIVQLLKDELSALRHEFKLTQSATSSPVGLAPSVQSLLDQLVDMGLPAGLQARLVHVWRDLADPVAALGAMESWLLNTLPAAASSDPLRGVHVIAGPSGAGKTTVLAKLAHMASTQWGCESVAWISFADHRAGAWSQTQMLAAPSGVTTYRAQDAQALRLLVDELTHHKLVLIDTAGVAFEAQAQQVRHHVPQAQLHMVLPMDATLTHIRKALQAEGMQSLILTKADEANAPWALVQALCDVRPCVSYVGQGERVNTPLSTYTPAPLTALAMNTLAGEDTAKQRTPEAVPAVEPIEVPSIFDRTPASPVHASTPQPVKTRSAPELPSLDDWVVPSFMQQRAQRNTVALND